MEREANTYVPVSAAAGLIVSAAALLAFAVSANGESFEEQRAAISKAPATQSEAAILSLLESGIAEGKPAQAVTETQVWLRHNMPEDAAVLFLAGRAAELAGDAAAAAALFQQYLKRADPSAETVGQGVIAVHSLFRERLSDDGAAYAFNRSVCDRLAANPVARQFDQWFLEEATRRKDVVAVANRLHALIVAGIPEDLRVVHYDTYFRWLVNQAEGYCEQPGAAPSSDDLVASCKRLASAMEFNEELKLRLDWAVAVRAYNLARIAGEGAATDGGPKGRKKRGAVSGDPGGDASSPPVAEAAALLAKFPRYAKHVQHGWAGGGSGPHYRNDPAKYWPHEIEAKMAPIVAAATKLDPLQLADLLASWRNGHYDDQVVRPLQVKVVSDWLAAHPELAKGRGGILQLPKPWNRLTPEEAQALGSQIAAVDDPLVSLVRAIAAGGAEKDLDKMISALLGPEAWRLGPGELDGGYAEQLWHYAGSPGDSPNRDEKIKDSKAVAETIKAAALTMDTPAAKRTARFEELWNDYRSSQPKIAGVVGQLRALVSVTPEAMPQLLADGSPEAQGLARDAIAAGITGMEPIWAEIEDAKKVDVSTYSPGLLSLARRHAGGIVAELEKRHPGKYRPHPLEGVMRKAVAAGVKREALEPWQVIAWINMQYPEDNAEQVALVRSLSRSDLWERMPFEVRFAARKWFGKDVMTPGQIAWIDAADPALVARDLLSLGVQAAAKPGKKGKRKDKADQTEKAGPGNPAADVKAEAAALQSAIKGLSDSPVKIELPVRAMENLAALDAAVFSDPESLERILRLVDQLKAAPTAEEFGSQLTAMLAKNPDPVLIQRAASYIWAHVNGNVRNFPAVMELTESLLGTHPSAASSLASAGLDAFARHHGHSYFKRDSDVPKLKSIRGNAAMKMGLIVIPVEKGSPAYPVYQSQGDWITGNEDSAWELLDANWKAFLQVHRELSMSYLKWVLQRVIYGRDEVRQEELIKALLGWANEAGSPLSAEEKAGIEIAYGDIAMQRGQLREAHEIYSRVRDGKAYQETPLRYQAALRRAAAERIARNFDSALQTLKELEMERVSGIWTDIRYARAEVYFDMEEYEDAKDDIDSILAREPNHPDTRILLGKVQLKRQKLMEATEVEIGSSSAQKSLVPGEKLKVTLSDPTLAVSGAGTEIDVVVWATSGDREQFFLRQFGDQKTKFRGEVATALGAPNEGDDILQVIGDDEVYYAYSERFRAKMNNIPEKRGGPIIIASDAILMASARRLLSEAEQRTADMAALMDGIRGKGDRDAGNTEAAARAELASRAMSAEARTGRDGFSEAEFQRFLADVAKPGNPLHVRVIDPDRSRTAGIDELAVSVATSSGDTVSRVSLKETGTHSGWFEGSIPTRGAQALAFARDSEPGRNPNMVISPAADTYPAWRPVAGAQGTPDFRIDLNDNVALGEMKIRAAEPGAKLGAFFLETGMNESEMRTVASFPKQHFGPMHPWQPSVTVINDTDQHHTSSKRILPGDLPELRAHMERGWLVQQYAQTFAANVVGLPEALPGEVLEAVDWKRQDRHKISSVIYRFKGHFYEKSSVERRFQLQLGEFEIPLDTRPSIKDAPKFVVVIDGRPFAGENGKLDAMVSLKPGVHTFEIWGSGWVRNFGFGKREVRLLANLEDPVQLVECPEDFFDPATFPEGALDHRNSPAAISVSEDGTEFTVNFAPDSRTRLLRLVLMKQEGPVPALNKITLSDAGGGTVLPVAEDFATLNKNDILEILSGDRITVRYADDRFVTATKQRQERSLRVSFTDARTEFASMEPRHHGRQGEDAPYYEKLLRFRYNEPLSLAVHDADMDTTADPDVVKVTISSGTGGGREVTATETGDSTGIFKLTIKPVAGGPTGADEIEVAEGGTIVARYLDRENNRPGVPTERMATIRHAAFTVPVLKLSHAAVTPYEGDAIRPLVHGFERRDYLGENRSLMANERIRPRWQIENTLLPGTAAPEGGFTAVHGRRLFVELVAPQLALGTASSVTLYAQTDAGRRRAGVGERGSAFDINVPGTIALTATVGQVFGRGGSWSVVPELETYIGGAPPSVNPEFDRFRFTVPLVAGVLPDLGALTNEERKKLEREAETSRSAAEFLESRISGLIVQPGEEIHIGFEYSDRDGKPKWVTATAKVVTHPAFDVMGEDFRESIESAYVGETLNLRVVDLGADVSDASDTVKVLVQSKSGSKHMIDLRESGPHTGIFKAGCVLSYADDKTPTAPDGEAGGLPAYDLRRDGFPVTYGDTLAARYTDSNGVKSQTSMVTISKGADGSIRPFSKTYDDEEIAMRTQFSLAEAYLEMAKRHRLLGEEDAAAIEQESAKQLLSKAMDQFTDSDTRAHAEYLLGSLTMEEADTTEDAELKEIRYRAALSRFLSVTGSYPQTLHASRAQYRIATLYERLDEPDIAAQEYVKLAYKYPDSEYLATSMARLGSHFLRTAASYESKAKPLLEEKDDKDAHFEGQALHRMAVHEYLKTAQIFGRLQERFPGDELAGQAGLRAGQAYMRADKKQEAIEAFGRVIAEESYDGPEIRAQAIYWSGMCYLDLRQQMAAYSSFKRLTYDFPESKWAAYARGQLSQESLLKLEDKLELERLEEARQ